jgi:hypothetical protein
MTLLDIQAMEPEHGHGGGGGDTDSSASLLLCDSVASVTLCL